MRNQKWNEFQHRMKEARVAVLGVGISNKPLIRFIYKLGAEITAFDALPADDRVLSKTRADFESEGITINWSCGPDYLARLKDEPFDFIFRTPQMRPDLPELLSAHENGSILTSEMEVFMDLCPARIFAVTGSDGKTTTTTLLSLFLEKAGHKVFLGGNIGTPLLDRIGEVTDEDMVVLELSSFQLLSMRASANVALVTNITPNHLNVHKDYQEYIDTKRTVFANQEAGDRVILNYDNEITREMMTSRRGSGCFFSRKIETVSPLLDLLYEKNGVIYSRVHGVETQLLNTADILLPGEHNIENYMAAMAAVLPYVPVRVFAETANTFPGVEHRCELVRTLRNVRYYNSSIDSSPNRTIHTLKSLAQRGERGVLIAGGADKMCDYTGLGQAILSVCDRIVLCGSNAPFIRQALEKECDGRSYRIIDTERFEETVPSAASLAEDGEIVILSPVGTSYDQFRHFEERGKYYKELVNAL